MIDFTYTAKDLTSGQVVKAEVKAESVSAAAKLLRSQNLFALDITPQGDGNILTRIGVSGRITTKEKVIFTRQLSTLVDAGLPIAKALRTVAQQINSVKFKRVINSVVASVEGGSGLSNAFSQHPAVFNEIYISLVEAGETSGTLDKALTRLANQQEKDAAIAAKIRGAMIYPAIVLALITAVVILMLTTVVPEVAKLYEDLKKELPLPTQILIFMSEVLKNFWWAFLLAMGPAIYGIRKLLVTEGIQKEIDRYKLTMPLFGILFKKVYMARFARTMHTLLASGIPMLEAMETARNAISNRLLAADVNEAINLVRGGKSLSEGLESSPHFLPLVAQMSKIGEESGAIDNMLDKVATYYEDEVDEAVKNLSTTLEPVMMVVMGVIVMGVIVAVLGPVYSLIGGGGVDQLK
ncbi:MAG TPA: type II secretion system F family protein [Candidatus Saccharimonadia bacterium]